MMIGSVCKVTSESEEENVDNEDSVSVDGIPFNEEGSADEKQE